MVKAKLKVETRYWGRRREGKEKSRIRAIQMNNLRGLLGIRRMDRVSNAWIKELCGMTKGVDERS